MAKLITGKGIGFQQLLEACRNSKFVALDLNNGVIGNFQLTPIGRMLRNNLREEFKRSDTETVVYEGSCGVSLRENLQFVKESFSTNLPFGIALEKPFRNEKISLSESFQLALPTGSFLTRSYFVNPSVSREYMYKVQRQRKIWWMRFACDPGRYSISDTRQDAESRIQTTSIRAQLGGEELTLEQLELIPSATMQEELAGFQAKIGRTNSRKITPDVIRIEQCVELATLEVIMDAIESGGLSSVRIHRKLAPYKCGIVCVVEGASRLEELRDLASHLANVLRRANVTALDCTSPTNGSSERTLTKQLNHLDSIGVPFSLVLRDQSLQAGLLQLRSRDTTISETIHISDLPHYLLRIITN
ncbi:DNA polymerase subunit gamma-2, mitochondrial [Topomyia yanbarensis]|uniref:DNA polymerase subunit gamma-2, mitochondrial n=1 Tax=Topomyia yanbarensis TaxID=2498891 RepID=UPI00273A97AF|nr:DNA polymerase subunit gamma-2, mitochondrial [Topomyia yanbarensis]